MISLEQQISEVKRELSMRAAVYPGLVAKKKMRQGEADMHVARMTAALKSLEWLAANEFTIKEMGGLGGAQKIKHSDWSGLSEVWRRSHRRRREPFV